MEIYGGGGLDNVDNHVLPSRFTRANGICVDSPCDLRSKDGRVRLEFQSSMMLPRDGRVRHKFQSSVHLVRHLSGARCQGPLGAVALRGARALRSGPLPFVASIFVQLLPACLLKGGFQAWNFSQLESVGDIVLSDFPMDSNVIAEF